MKVKNVLGGLLGLFGMNDIPVPTSTTAPIEAKKPRKPRFNAGDRFYQFLSYKRIVGKWKVRR